MYEYVVLQINPFIEHSHKSFRSSNNDKWKKMQQTINIPHRYSYFYLDQKKVSHALEFALNFDLIEP